MTSSISNHPRRRLYLTLVGLPLLAAAAGVAYLVSGDTEGTGRLTLEVDPDLDRTSLGWRDAEGGSQLSLEVDLGLTPRIETVPGLHDGDPPRPVGRVQDEDGIPMDLVLDEIMVTYENETALDRFLASIDGEVVDRFDDEGEPVRDALVSFPRHAVDDAAAVAAALTALEDDLAGGWTVSDRAVLAVLDMLAKASDAGVVAMPNVLHEHAGIAEGSTSDGNSPYGPDVFAWPYVASGTAQDIGLDVAWRLLADIGVFDEKPAGWAHRVRIMVVDQGFRLNDDVPRYRTIRRADWGDEASDSYGATWHGAMVVNGIMGRVDNGFGGAGPAGPLDAGLIAVGDADPSSWSNVRSLVRLVDEHRPDVINMSYSARITATRLAYQDFYERKFSTIKHDYGALALASAGNDSRNIDDKRRGAAVERVLVFPCEASHVVCVGGMGEDTTLRAGSGCGDTSGSNYGTRTGGRSVEIWGPYWVIAHSGTSGNPGRACGTSFASPFVAGVAALVKAADPTLDPDGIWSIVKDTAHDGGIGSEVTGHQRRINAREAVLRAYGKHVEPPQVAITSPRHDATIHVGEWVDLTAQTRDHRGRTDLAVTWMSNKDGKLAGPSKGGAFTESLSVGTHSLVASVTDGIGQTTHTQVLVRVVERPITVTVSSPHNSTEIPTTQGVTLIGNASDDLRPLETISGDLLRWTVTPAADPTQVLTERVGRTASIPAGDLEPGNYTARLTVIIGAQAVTEEVTFTVVEPDPEAPTVHILAPTDAQEYTTSTGSAALQLRASATDWHGNPLPGTRLRWIARIGGNEQLLCAGGDTPGGAAHADGGFVISQSCDDVDVTLDVPIGTSSWSIILEGYATPQLKATATHGIEVDFTPPPVP